MCKREKECVYVCVCVCVCVCVYIWEVYMGGFSAHVHVSWLCVH